MTTISMPMIPPGAEAADQSRQAWPWLIALVLCTCFASATWQWFPDQFWYSSNQNDVSALVGRISEGTWQRQAGFGALGLCGMYLVALPSSRRIRFKPVLIYGLLLFLTWAFISIVWSVDRGQTMRRLIGFGALCVTVAGVLKHYDIRQIAQIGFIASVVTMFIGIGNEIRLAPTNFPGLGIYRFGGVMHPNHAALNATIVILSGLYLFRLERRWWLLAMVLLAGVVLVATKSRTALMACMTGVSAFLLMATTPKRAAMALLLCAWLAGAAAWMHSMQMLPSFSSIISMGREDLKHTDPSKLTGRTDIWKFALMQANKDPNRAWIGYGFETFWTPENARGVSEFTKFKISEGHNVYLDWYLELGMVGVTLYLLLMLSALLRWTTAARTLASPSCAVAAAVIAAAMVHGLAESSSGDASLPTFFLYISIAMATFARPDEVEDDPEVAL